MADYTTRAIHITHRQCHCRPTLLRNTRMCCEKWRKIQGPCTVFASTHYRNRNLAFHFLLVRGKFELSVWSFLEINVRKHINPIAVVGQQVPAACLTREIVPSGASTSKSPHLMILFDAFGSGYKLFIFHVLRAVCSRSLHDRSNGNPEQHINRGRGGLQDPAQAIGRVL